MNFTLTGIVALAAFATTTQGAIIINEIANGNGGAADAFDRDEAVEILLTTDYTAAQLNGLAFGDSTGSTADKFSQFTVGDLSSIAATFKAGTLIVLAGNNFTADTSYDPDSSDWNVTLRADSGFFSETVATSDGDFAVGGSGDVVWIDFNNTGDTDFTVDHAVGWDTGADGVFLTSGGNVVNTGFSGSVGTGDFVAFVGGSADILDSSKFVDNGTTGSIGSANGGDNTSYIDTLRVPEPSIALLSGLGLLGLLRRRR